MAGVRPIRGANNLDGRDGADWLRPLEDCQVLLRDRLPAYISWEQFTPESRAVGKPDTGASP